MPINRTMTPSTIAHYRITAKLGEGGMGEVWRATDTKLNRDVAIKILPESFAHDPDRLARFTREAQVLAALNHPNIAAIHGVEENALVMELVEGPTLAERIAKGAIPLDEALSIAKQIAEALEYAHERGIVHRDLKPANIKITPEGRVKVLDFGLAKAMTTEVAVHDPVSSPTLTMRAGASAMGMILGTAAYMSPEQARGQAVDKRADIWAFGVVLHEMLTGHALFVGPTVSDTLAAVLTREPDLTRVPVKVRRLLQSCLQKDPKRRLQAIADWRLLMEDAPERASAAKSRLPWPAIAVGSLAIAAIALWAPWRARLIEPTTQPLIRLPVDLGPDVSSTGSASGADVIISPDGSRIVYLSQSRLFTRRLDQPNATELAGTELAAAPFFSPDSQWVAFFSQAQLKKVSMQGGRAVTVCNFPSFSAAGSWGEDGNIIASRVSNVLLRIPAEGGMPVPVTELAAGETRQSFPQVLPGGKAVLFTSFASTVQTTIQVMSLGDRRRKTVHRGGTFARYLPSGHLVYLDQGTLFAVPFDLSRLEVSGTPVPVLDEVASNTARGSAQFDFSRNGIVVYGRSGGGGGLVTVQWLDSAGQMRPLLGKPGDYLYPHLSPDGNRLALVAAGDIWVYDLRRESMTRLTFDGAHIRPTWTPDGLYLVFPTADGMFWTRADGGTKPQPLTHTQELQYPWSFTPDGKRLAFHGPNSGSGRFGIGTVALESDGTGLRAGKPEPFLQAPVNERHPSFSPDGRWLAYTSLESGTSQVYVRAFPDNGSKWVISTSGGLYPEWSRSQHELFFRTVDSQVMVVTYTANGDAFQPDKPRLWSEKRLANVGVVGGVFDVAPDGKRIAALMPAEGPDGQKARNHLVFLLNFFAYLRQRVPTTGGK
jgi:serine/threonine-protein kinase